MYKQEYVEEDAEYGIGSVVLTVRLKDANKLRHQVCAIKKGSIRPDLVPQPHDIVREMYILASLQHIHVGIGSLLTAKLG